MELIQTVVVPIVAPPRFNDLSLCPNTSVVAPQIPRGSQPAISFRPLSHSKCRARTKDCFNVDFVFFCL